MKFHNGHSESPKMIRSSSVDWSIHNYRPVLESVILLYQYPCRRVYENESKRIYNYLVEMSHFCIWLSIWITIEGTTIGKQKASTNVTLVISSNKLFLCTFQNINTAQYNMIKTDNFSSTITDQIFLDDIINCFY